MISPEKRAALVRILRGMKASNGFDAEVAADDLIEFFEAEDEVAHWKRKARKLGEYAAATRKVCKAYAYATLGGTMRQHAIDGHVRRSIRSAMRKPC